MRRQVWIPLCSIVFGLGSLLTLATTLFQEILHQKIESKAARFAQRWQAQFQFESWTPSFQGLVLENFKFFAKDFHINGNLVLNPRLQPDYPFLGVSAVSCVNCRIKLHPKGPSSQLASPAVISAPASKPLAITALALPFRLALKKTQIELVDQDQQTLVAIKDLFASIDPAEGQWQIQAQSLKYKDQTLLYQLSGQWLVNGKRDRWPFSLSAREKNQDPWNIQGSLGSDLDSLELRYKRRGIPVAWQPLLASIEPKDALEWLLKISLHGLRQRKVLDFDIQIVSNNFAIKHPFLSSDKVGPWPFTLRARGEFHPRQGQFRIDQGLIYLQKTQNQAPIKSYFQAAKSKLFQDPHIDPWTIQWQLPPTDCQTFIDLLPKGAFPLIEDFKLGGKIALAANIQLLPKDEQAIRFPAQHTRFSCQIAQAPTIFSQSFLSRRQHAREADFLLKNPAYQAFLSPQFMAIQDIQEDFLRSLIAAEDASFWQHEGVRTSALTAAFEANLKAGKVLFGGSTITMQMVKNLYLSHEKVLSRKLQEVFLSWAIEQAIPKKSILEIYANIIEFGPQLRGIRLASDHYFQKPAAELTTAESVFLASILPSPHRYYRDNICQPHLESGLLQRMQKVADSLAITLASQPIQQEFHSSLRHFQFAQNRACLASKPKLFNRDPKDLRPTQAL